VAVGSAGPYANNWHIILDT